MDNAVPDADSGPVSGPDTCNGCRRRTRADGGGPCNPNAVNRKASNRTGRDDSRVRSCGRSSGRTCRSFRWDSTLRSFRRAPPSDRPRYSAAALGTVRHTVPRRRHHNRDLDSDQWLGSRQQRTPPARARQACVSSFPPKDLATPRGREKRARVGARLGRYHWYRRHNRQNPTNRKGRVQGSGFGVQQAIQLIASLKN